MTKKQKALMLFLSICVLGLCVGWLRSEYRHRGHGTVTGSIDPTDTNAPTGTGGTNYAIATIANSNGNTLTATAYRTPVSRGQAPVAQIVTAGNIEMRSEGGSNNIQVQIVGNDNVVDFNSMMDQDREPPDMNASHYVAGVDPGYSWQSEPATKIAMVPPPDWSGAYAADYEIPAGQNVMYVARPGYTFSPVIFAPASVEWIPLMRRDKPGYRIDHNGMDNAAGWRVHAGHEPVRVHFHGAPIMHRRG